MNHSKLRTGIPLLFKRLPWLQAQGNRLKLIRPSE
jgi:hypothetical protein